MIGRFRRAQQSGNATAFSLVPDADRYFPIHAAPADHVKALMSAPVIVLDDGAREGLTEGGFDLDRPCTIGCGRTQSFDESHHLIHKWRDE